MITTSSRILNNELFTKRVADILKTGIHEDGPYRLELEQKFARDYNVKHVRAVATQDMAFKWPLLLLASKGISAGKIVVPSFGNIQTISSMLQIGYKPMFCDIGDDLCVDPDSLDRRVDSNVIAAIPSNMLGNLADYNYLDKYKGMFKIFDSSSALGICDDFNAKYVGTFGDCEVIDFSQNQMCGAFGGSLLATNNDELGQFAISTLDEIRSAAILTQLEQIEDIQSQRFDAYQMYKAMLPDWVQLQQPNVYFSNFPIVCKVHPALRDSLVLYLVLSNIAVGVVKPIHKSYETAKSLILPNTERLAAQIFTLPAGVGEAEISKINQVIRSFVHD